MKLSDFKLLDDPQDQDRLTVLVQDFNRTRTLYPRDRTVPGLFAEQAAATPEAVAVIHAETALCYQDVEQRANRLARFLLDRHLQPETLVGVMLDRSPAMIVAMLGILKAGAAYFPINHEWPPERIKYLLQDSRAPLLITETRHLHLCRSWRAHCPALKTLLCMDRRDAASAATSAAEFDDRALEVCSPAPLPERSRPDSLAYVIYTSGTTGRPKGVMAPQRAIVRLVRDTHYIALGPEERILQTGSLAFDASTFEIWGALLNGGCVCLPPQESLLNAAELTRLIRRHRITTVFLTTGLFNMLAGENPEVFTGLKTVLSGGEKVSVRHFDKVRKAHPGLALNHVYGPTENTTFTTCHRVTAPGERDIPIGAPIANTTVYVLDARLEPVDIGSPGELYAGGDGLARGYLNDPALTAEKFIPHPFSEGERLYRTGDLACWRPDGTLEFLGRRDDQVKILGYRIEPAEIAARLLEHDQIKEAVVLVREAAGDKQLVAYFTARRSLDGAALRAHLKETLPDYMLPAYWIQLDRLPLNPNGKVDKKALPAPESARCAPEPAALSETQQLLLSIWQEVLGRQAVGLDEDFFELGGHSLKATKLASLIHKRLGLVLPFTTVFKAPTVRQLAHCILDAARFGVEGIDQPLVLLNGSATGRPIFGFPPATADALGYGQLAERLKPYAFYAFNFIEADTRMQDYADAIVQADSVGPYLLFGYSGGGNLAFQVARELESRGRRVAAVVMLDSARFQEKFRFPLEEARWVAAQFLDADSVKPYLTSPVLRDKAFRNIERYYAYFSDHEDNHSIAAAIHLLISENSQDIYRDDQGRIICDKQGWAAVTRGGFKTYPGHGEHNFMLYPPYLEPNSALLRGIFDRLCAPA